MGWLQTTLIVCQYVSVLLTAVFAVLGVLKKYKEDDGTVTRWGRVAVIGIIACGLMSAISQSIQMALGRTDAAKSAARTEEEIKRGNVVLTNINRTLHPIKQIKVSIERELSPDDTEFAVYERWLSDEVPRLLPQLVSAPTINTTVIPGNDKKPESLMIRPGSPIFPKPGSPAYGPASVIGMRIYLARKPPPAQQRFDWSAYDISAGGMDRAPVLIYNILTKKLSQLADIEFFDVESKDSLVSTLDIPGTTLMVDIFQQKGKVTNLILVPAEGVKFPVDLKQMKETQDSDKRVLSYTYPEQNPS